MRFPAYPRRAAVAQLLALATATAWLPSAYAADLYYFGAQYTPGPGYPAPWPTDGSWFDTNLWQNNTLPTSTTNAIFGSNQPMPNTNTTHAPHILHFGNFGYYADTVIPGGTATLAAATITQGAWTFDFASGQNPDFTGTLTPSTGSLAVTSLTLTPAAGQSPSLTLQNGTLSATSLTLASQPGSALLILATGSYLKTTSGTIGLSGSGSIIQNGTHMITGSLVSGYNTGAMGLYTLESGLLSVIGYEFLGYSGSATFTQTGGTHKANSYLYMGYSGGSGTYSLSNGLLTTNEVNVGYHGFGSFSQTGGTHTTSSYLYLGHLGGSGIYNLADGLLTAHDELVAYYGPGSFIQTGGTNTTSSMYVGFASSSPASAGYYELNDGQLNTSTTYVGAHCLGSLSQSGGTHTVTGSLLVGYDTGAVGCYSLGKGLLTVSSEIIGVAGTGSFTQTGGTHTIGALSIGPNSVFSLTGGTLQVTGGLANQGSLILGGPTTLDVAGMVDLTQVMVQDLSAFHLTLAANSLLILPSNLTTNQFSHFTNNGGTVTQAGTTIHILAGQVLDAGGGSCHEPLVCAGTLTGSATLLSGILVQGTGAQASLTTLRIDDSTSGLIDGKLSATTEYVGYSGTGTFTQIGGTHTVGSQYVGYSGNGVFTQSGGTHSLGSLYVGYSGTGQFALTGGSQTLSGSLVLGYNAGAAGTYALSGGDLRVTGSNYVGYSGTGTFTQAGGSHTTSLNLFIGYGAEAIGTYTLNSGTLSAYKEYLGYAGVGSLVQTGGTHITSARNVEFCVAYQLGAKGTYVLYDGLVSSGLLRLGYKGTGVFTQFGGTHTVTGWTLIGSDFGSTGTYVLSGGLFSSYYVGVGAIGNSLFLQTGGTHTVTTNLLVLEGHGVYALSGGVLNVPREFVSSGGSFTQTGGIHTVAGTLTIDRSGFFSLTGGTLQLSAALVNSGSLVIGGTAALTGSAAVDLSRAILTDVSQVTIDLSSGTTLALPSSVTPSNFGRFQNLGITFQEGGTLNVPAGTLATLGSSNFNLTVSCAGTLTHSGTLTGGLSVDGVSASVTLGTVMIEDLASGLGAGRLQASRENIGYSGSGVFTQTGGTHTVTSALYLGYNTGTVGVYALSDGVLTVPQEVLGYAGRASFAQTGGTHTVNSSLCLGTTAGSSGTYTLSNGVFTVNASVEYIGQSGEGTLTHAGGTHTVSGSLSLGYNAAARGVYTLTTGQLTVGSHEYVGQSGTGTFTQTGGTHTISQTLFIGNNAGSSGVYVLSGGQLTAATEFVGNSGIGSLIQSGGTHLISGSLQVGTGADSRGTVIMEDGTLSLGLLTVAVANTATGTINQSGGFIRETVYLGGAYEWRVGASNAGAIGVYNLAGGTLTLVPNFQVGAYGTGFFNQTGGTATFNGWTCIGRFSGGVGHMTVSAGTLTHGGFSSTHLIVGEQGTGDLTISGTGLVQLATTLYMNYSSLTSGTVYLNGGMLVCPGVSVISTASPKAYFYFNGGTLKANTSSTTFLQGLASAKIQAGGAMIDTNGYTITIAQPLTEDSASRGGSLVKLGAGTLTLTGTGIHFDGLQVAAGNLALQSALKVNSTSAPRGTSAVALDIAPGGLTFGTSGSLDITNHDMLLRYSPGAGTTALSMARSWLQSSQIKSTSLTTNQALACVNNAALATPFTSFDGIALADANQILVKYTWKGDANLDGKINFNDYLALDAGYLFGGSDWTHGDFTGDSQVTVADYVAIDAAVLAQNQVLASSMIDLHSQQFGKAYTEALAAAVPEPASLVLLSLGSLSLLGRRKGIPVFKRALGATGLAPPERSQRSSEL